jgi:hypothetical protein
MDELARQLISCPCCGSELIQIGNCLPGGDDRTLVERRCPECPHRDEIDVRTAIADALVDYDAALSAGLLELAEYLRSVDEIWITP